MQIKFGEIFSVLKEKIKNIDYSKIILCILLVIVVVYVCKEYYDSINREGDFRIRGSQVFVLETSNDIYDRIEIGMSKNEILPLFENVKIKSLNVVDDTGIEYEVFMESDSVADVNRMIHSSKYDNIQLSTELNTEIEDLRKVIKNVNEGMTLTEVESVLGNQHIEIGKDIYGTRVYVWYDKLENYVRIYFNEDNMVEFTS